MLVANVALSLKTLLSKQVRGEGGGRTGGVNDTRTGHKVTPVQIHSVHAHCLDLMTSGC